MCMQGRGEEPYGFKLIPRESGGLISMSAQLWIVKNYRVGYSSDNHNAIGCQMFIHKVFMYISGSESHPADNHVSCMQDQHLDTALLQCIQRFLYIHVESFTLLQFLAMQGGDGRALTWVGPLPNLLELVLQVLDSPVGLLQAGTQAVCLSPLLRLCRDCSRLLLPALLSVLLAGIWK